MMMRMTLVKLLSCLAALVLAVGIVRAQTQASTPNALQGFSQNRNEPVQINSQTLEVRDKKQMATFSGNVILVQGDTTLRCKTMVVYYDGGALGGPAVKVTTPAPVANQQIRRIVATGSVVVTQKGQTATGEKAVYDISDDTVRLFPPSGGFVAVTQGPNVVQGRRLLVHLDTGISHFEGGARSLFMPNSTKGENQPAPTAPHSAPKSRATDPSGLY